VHFTRTNITDQTLQCAVNAKSIVPKKIGKEKKEETWTILRLRLASRVWNLASWKREV